ncbi:MAG: metal ABC transporter permease [Bdellovibrionales bacterium]|nr:metal ABC transporter permease [Bdellovibrionales bacterium]
MSNLHQIISLDLPPLLTAVCAALSCTLLGNFLLLRKISLMGDAISHSVLPGIVAAFLISNHRDPLTIFIGAAAAGLLSAVCIETLRSLGNLEPGAAMGVVFSLFFAAGILLMEGAAARHIDLDANCLLYGQLESIFWYPPTSMADLLTVDALWSLPPQVLTSIGVLIACTLFVLLLFKELKLTAFDPALATSLGFNATAVHYLLMVFVATAVVASFEAVGSILVIAMIICPAATARLFTDNLRVQIALSAVIAIATTVLGYFLGAFGPELVGRTESVSIAGSITLAAGFFLTTAALFAPQYGYLGRQIRHRRLALQMALEDVLGVMFRIEEARGLASPANREVMVETLGGQKAVDMGIAYALREKLIEKSADNFSLTERGRIRAQDVVRSHRLWESYLVSRLGLQADHVHDTAMELEHFTDQPMAEKLAKRLPNPELDPHGKKIPSLNSVDDES